MHAGAGLNSTVNLDIISHVVLIFFKKDGSL
jgi:hypothetical protein